MIRAVRKLNSHKDTVRATDVDGHVQFVPSPPTFYCYCCYRCCCCCCCYPTSNDRTGDPVYLFRFHAIPLPTPAPAYPLVCRRFFNVRARALWHGRRPNLRLAPPTPPLPPFPPARPRRIEILKNYKTSLTRAFYGRRRSFWITARTRRVLLFI